MSTQAITATGIPHHSTHRHDDTDFQELNEAVAKLKETTNKLTAAAGDPTNPFGFDDQQVFTFENGIFALATSIQNLLGIQPQIIASEMEISTELVSPRLEAWTQKFNEMMQDYASKIQGLDPKSSTFTKDLATLQGDMSVANAESSAASTGLNGVLGMLTSGTSSKTSTYQNLVQQANSVVTALLNAMTQNWQ